MDAYRRFLQKTASVSYAVILLASAVVGILTYPTVSVLGSGFDETTAVTTLAILLAGFCLVRLLFLLWDRKLDGKTALMLGLGVASALAVIPVRNALPFVLKGYVFPLLTGLGVPRLLLSLLPEKQGRRLDRILAVLSGSVLALLGGVSFYGSLHAASLSGAVICRLTALSLLWFAPLFDRYARQCGFGGVFLSVGLWILPIPAVFGILWEDVFALFPAGLLLAVIGLVLDALRRQKTQKPQKN
jgi:hypothetical protein